MTTLTPEQPKSSDQPETEQNSPKTDDKIVNAFANILQKFNASKKNSEEEVYQEQKHNPENNQPSNFPEGEEETKPQNQPEEQVVSPPPEIFQIQQNKPQEEEEDRVEEIAPPTPKLRSKKSSKKFGKMPQPAKTPQPINEEKDQPSPTTNGNNKDKPQSLLYTSRVSGNSSKQKESKQPKSKTPLLKPVDTVKPTKPNALRRAKQLQIKKIEKEPDLTPITPLIEIYQDSTIETGLTKKSKKNSKAINGMKKPQPQSEQILFRIQIQLLPPPVKILNKKLQTFRNMSKQSTIKATQPQEKKTSPQPEEPERKIDIKKTTFSSNNKISARSASPEPKKTTKKSGKKENQHSNSISHLKSYENTSTLMKQQRFQIHPPIIDQNQPALLAKISASVATEQPQPKPGRVNTGASTLLDLVRQLHNLKFINTALFKQFQENHSINDIQDFLSKFQTGKLHRFNFNTYKFTILDHRRISELLSHLWPDRFYKGTLSQNNSDIQGFLLDLYNLDAQSYYKLYSKIDVISQIKWWSKILTAQDQKLLQNNKQRRINKRRAEQATQAVQNVINAAQKLSISRISELISEEVENKPKRKGRKTQGNQEQEGWGKKAEKELGKIRNIVSTLTKPADNNQNQQNNAPDFSMRKKIKFY